jgi:translation elongation factor P/translation initiation factor 5A
MDQESFETLTLSGEMIGDALDFISMLREERGWYEMT